jgi:glycosyltransferase involved in cell wall biosynthesis
MNLILYTPFKPLDHGHPSGDLITALGIRDYLLQRGHQVRSVGRLRCRWIYWKPWRWPALIAERRRVVAEVAGAGMDLWLTYHTYYKAPDLLGPPAAERLGLPYVIFQGIFSTKRRRRPATVPGFYLNRRSLRAARHVFTNKRGDLLNLRRIIPEGRLSYIAPGLIPGEFVYDDRGRRELRRQWGVGEEPVVLSVAMFRPGVKTEGLSWVIRACGAIYGRGCRLRLVIVGDGKERAKLERLAAEVLPQRVIFAGRVARPDLPRYYSAADLFAFPGIQESLGMVYLEAQSCGLPAVAFDNAGVGEAIADGRTGCLVPKYDAAGFEAAIARLLSDVSLRRSMGRAARDYVRREHDLTRNYQEMESVLQDIVACKTANVG